MITDFYAEKVICMPKHDSDIRRRWESDWVYMYKAIKHSILDNVWNSDTYAECQDRLASTYLTGVKEEVTHD